MIKYLLFSITAYLIPPLISLIAPWSTCLLFHTSVALFRLGYSSLEFHKIFLCALKTILKQANLSGFIAYMYVSISHLLRSFQHILSLLTGCCFYLFKSHKESRTKYLPLANLWQSCSDENPSKCFQKDCFNCWGFRAISLVLQLTTWNEEKFLFVCEVELSSESVLKFK